VSSHSSVISALPVPATLLFLLMESFSEPLFVPQMSSQYGLILVLLILATLLILLAMKGLLPCPI
jgi:hypothetical protein